MTHKYRAVRQFWKAFDHLTKQQKQSAWKAWEFFKHDPFDPRLRAHKIHRLSSLYKVTIYAVEIEGNLRSTFYIDGDTVVSVDIGTHAIYEK